MLTQRIHYLKILYTFYFNSRETNNILNFQQYYILLKHHYRKTKPNGLLLCPLTVVYLEIRNNWIVTSNAHILYCRWLEAKSHSYWKRQQNDYCHNQSYHSRKLFSLQAISAYLERRIPNYKPIAALYCVYYPMHVYTCVQHILGTYQKSVFQHQFFANFWFHLSISKKV